MMSVFSAAKTNGCPDFMLIGSKNKVDKHGICGILNSVVNKRLEIWSRTVWIANFPVFLLQSLMYPVRDNVDKRWSDF